MNPSSVTRPRQKASALMYQDVSRRSEIEGASPHKLIELLLQGAVKNIHIATEAIEKKDIVARGQALSNAIAIVTELNHSLDQAKGEMLAENLGILYQYIITSLFDAHLSGERQGLDEAMPVLLNILDAWMAIKHDEKS